MFRSLVRAVLFFIVGIVLISVVLAAPETGSSVIDRHDRGISSSGGLSPTWLDQVKEEIYDTQFEFAVQADGSWAAANPDHGFLVAFGESGVVISSRQKGDTGQESVLSVNTGQSSAFSGDTSPWASTWSLGLNLVCWGREGNLEVVGDSSPRVDGNRAEYDRGMLTEWYVKSRRGLKQGFTIDAPPSSGDPDLPLILEMEIDGAADCEKIDR